METIDAAVVFEHVLRRHAFSDKSLECNLRDISRTNKLGKRRLASETANQSNEKFVARMHVATKVEACGMRPRKTILSRIG